MKTPEPLSTIEAQISAYALVGASRVGLVHIADISGYDSDSVCLNAAECREIAAKLTEIADWIEAEA